MQVLGYINCNNYVPSPVEVLAKDEDSNDFILVHPSGKADIIEKDTAEELRQSHRFFNENEQKSIKRGWFGFAVNESFVIVNTPNNVFLELRKLINGNSSHELNFSNETKAFIEEFLRNNEVNGLIDDRKI